MEKQPSGAGELCGGTLRGNITGEHYGGTLWSPINRPQVKDETNPPRCFF